VVSDLGVVEESVRKRLTQNKVALIRQWVHVCETNETAPATLSQWRGGGDGETLPEWLREKGSMRPPGYITISSDSVDPAESQISQLFVICMDFFVLRVSVELRLPDGPSAPGSTISVITL